MNWGLFGALCVQVCKSSLGTAIFQWLLTNILDWYYLAFPKDDRVIKVLITIVFLMETAQTLIITNDCLCNTRGRHQQVNP